MNNRMCRKIKEACKARGLDDPRVIRQFRRGFARNGPEAPQKEWGLVRGKCLRLAEQRARAMERGEKRKKDI